MSEPITHKEMDIIWLFIIEEQVTLNQLHIWCVCSLKKINDKLSFSVIIAYVQSNYMCPGV